MTGHELFTHMLFVDAVVGVGIPCHEAGMLAEYQELCSLEGSQHAETWAWSRTALEELSITTLQELYQSLKMYEVTHASQ